MSDLRELASTTSATSEACTKAADRVCNAKRPEESMKNSKTLYVALLSVLYILFNCARELPLKHCAAKGPHLLRALLCSFFTALVFTNLPQIC